MSSDNSKLLHLLFRVYIFTKNRSCENTGPTVCSVKTSYRPLELELISAHALCIFAVSHPLPLVSLTIRICQSAFIIMLTLLKVPQERDSLPIKARKTKDSPKELCVLKAKLERAYFCEEVMNSLCV